MPVWSGRGTFYVRHGKRMLDMAAAMAALIVLGPVVLVLAALVRWKLGEPVLFRQMRPGLNARPFMMVKFRTMVEAYDAEGALLSDAERLTPFGEFLRATSLDELPELFNVLNGDMSLVGPRPLLMQYLERYTSEQTRRHEVRPGITGWAQVNGRNEMSWSRKFAYDVWYVDHVSPMLDLKILMKTLGMVLARTGINQPGSATANEFAESPMAEAFRVLIAGAGGHGQVIADVLMAAARQGTAVRVLGFLDDDASLSGSTRMGLEIFGAIADAQVVDHDAVIIGIGDNTIRRRVYEQLMAGDERLVTALHPRAVLAQDVEVGAGSVASASVTVNPGARIGVNVILNTGCIVEHHCRVGDHAHVAPGVRMGGEVEIGAGCLVGIGSVLLPGVRVGQNSIIGAGAVVTADVPYGVAVVGAPARVLRANARAGLAEQG